MPTDPPQAPTPDVSMPESHARKAERARRLLIPVPLTEAEQMPDPELEDMKPQAQTLVPLLTMSADEFDPPSMRARADGEPEDIYQIYRAAFWSNYATALRGEVHALREALASVTRRAEIAEKQRNRANAQGATLEAHLRASEQRALQAEGTVRTVRREQTLLQDVAKHAGALLADFRNVPADISEIEHQVRFDTVCELYASLEQALEALRDPSPGPPRREAEPCRHEHTDPDVQDAVRCIDCGVIVETKPWRGFGQ